MKLSQIFALCCTAVTTVGAFTPMMSRGHARSAFSMVASAPDDVVGESAMPVVDPYARIGVKEEELGIGIDATEFLQWIGR